MGPSVTTSDQIPAGCASRMPARIVTMLGSGERVLWGGGREKRTRGGGGWLGDGAGRCGRGEEGVWDGEGEVDGGRAGGRE